MIEIVLMIGLYVFGVIHGFMISEIIKMNNKAKELEDKHE